MTNIITLTLIKPLIIESVKNETFLAGNVNKATDAKTLTATYHEQAGNDVYQERLIERALYSALEELKSHLSDYLATSGYSSADNNIFSSIEGDIITVTLAVSDRFNKAYTQSLSRLAGKYIEECILMDWWKPINEKQAALYAQFVERNLQSIKRCFNKTAPIVPSVPYTKKLKTTGTAIEIAPGETATVTYTISDGAVDDIEAHTDDESICLIGRSEQGFTVKGHHRGHTYIKLFSRHNPDVARVIHVFVGDMD